MQPRFTTQSSEARSCTMGKGMRFRERCMIEQVSIHPGRGDGARFMKKNLPWMPFGYRFITMARACRCGSRAGATST
jgi:hypothetical protein